jgi:hypothetical protein
MTYDIFSLFTDGQSANLISDRSIFRLPHYLIQHRRFVAALRLTKFALPETLPR